MYALTSRKQDKSEDLREMLGKHLHLEQTEQERLIIKDTGGLRAARERLKAHAERARALLAQTLLDPEAKRFFDSFVSYIEESPEWYN